MAGLTKLLVVTDLDATLLDHDYSWAAAKPALDRLQSAGFPLVLNSSKTVAEMKALAEELELDTPIVAENGGLLAIPSSSALLSSGSASSRSDDYCIEIKGLSRDVILSAAHRIREEEGYDFAGFADWSVDEVARHTGLDLSSAGRSKARFATEPIIWKDTPSNLSDFTEALSADNIRILRGGRFLHLMGPADKANGSASVLELYQQSDTEINWVVVTLGDSANDQAMLEGADVAVVIPHEDGPRINPKAPRVVHAPFPASKGWNAALMTILDEYC